jgi:ureidoglycolate lyase
MTSRTIEELSPESFEPFGRVIARPSDPAQATGDGWRWWAEVAPLTGDDHRWGVGYLDLEPTDLRIEWAERHRRTDEAVVATSSEILLYVAPADDDAAEPSLTDLRVFRIPPGSAVVLDRGVWHGAPFASSGPTTALVFILEGTGASDVEVVRFPDNAIQIESGARAAGKD